MRIKAMAGRAAAAAAGWLAGALAAGAIEATTPLPTGDLVLIPAPGLAVAEQQVSLSPDRITVRHLLRNDGEAAIETAAALVVAPLEHGAGRNYALSPAGPVDLLGFALALDGAPSGYFIDAHAIGRTGRDVTALLERWELPLTPAAAADAAAFDAVRERVAALPAEALGELRRSGALAGDDGSFSAAWTAYVSYYWTLTIPAGGVAEIVHAYRPVPSLGFLNERELGGQEIAALACPDAAFAREAAALIEGQPVPALTASVLRYGLAAGNLWRDRVERFSLRVEPGAEAALAASCLPGLERRADGGLELAAADYRPEADLTVLFLAPLGAE